MFEPEKFCEVLTFIRIIVGRSIFSTAYEMGPLGNGVDYCRVFYQSLRPTQMELSLNLDMSTRAFYRNILVSDFVSDYLGKSVTRSLSDQRALKAVKRAYYYPCAVMRAFTCGAEHAYNLPRGELLCIWLKIINPTDFDMYTFGRTKTHERSNLVEEELEPTLLMAILDNEREVVNQEVSLHEEDVGYKETTKDSQWYLDNGANNHMTGMRDHFENLDEKVSGRVKFGDGSYIEIKEKVEKQNRAPFPKKAKGRSTSPLDLIYGDLCEPITPATPSGKRYIFLLVDDYSRYMWAYFLSTKDQAFDTFKEFKKTIENELRTTLKMFRTDRGGEFNSSEFTQYCKENGIARQLTAPYSPQQNGVVERRNRTIMSTTRCMMKATEMPQDFWAEAVRHAIYILNSVPTKALEDITPYEAIKGKNPNLKDLRVSGCIAYAKVPSQHLTKLDDISIRMVYLGNEHGSKAYRLFDPTTQRICVSRDVKFKEDEKWDWSKYLGENTNDEPEWTDFIIGNLEETNDHHDLENHPNKEDNDFPYNDDDGYDSPLANSTTKILHTSLT
nr:zinc finger, CCHC-type [Tanacetum cinerariifolium]